LKKLVVLLLAVAALASCGMKEQGGKIAIRFGNEAAKSILPPISMTVTEYVVTGDGPGSTAFGPLTVSGDTTVDNVVPGDWTLSVVGRNATGDAIGAGTGLVTVTIGQTAIANITVVEYTGDGSYALDLSWEPDIVTDPIFTGELKDSLAVVTPQVFATDPGTCTSTSTTTGLHAGWYANVVRLWDAPTGIDGSEVLSTGFAEAVRIAANQQTAADVFLHAVQGYGEIDIRFSLDFADPLILTGTPAFGARTVYAEFLNAFHVDAPEAATYVWYLRGQQIAVGDTLNFDASALFLGETYRLDVIGFSVDGRHAGSGTYTLTRAAATLVSSIALDAETVLNPPVGGYDVAATILPANATNKALTWTTSNPAVATVTPVNATTATILAHANGTATITCTAADGGGAFDTVAVTVNNH
jgi:hypothetical protein